MPVDAINTNEEGLQTFLFPEGLEAFAKKYKADVVHIYDDTVVYYHSEEKRWIVLDDSTSDVRSLSAVPRKPRSIPEVDGTPQQ